jgi:hypothetical protein
MPVPGQDLTPQNYTIDLLALAGVVELVINATATVYTKHFVLPRNVDFGALLKISSGGTIDVKVELEQGNTAPTDQAVDSSGLWGVGQVLSAGLTTAGTYPLAVSPPVTKFARLKFTGQGSNAATTKFTKIEIGVSKKF